MKKYLRKTTLIAVSIIAVTLNVKCNGGTKHLPDSSISAKDSSNDTSGTGGSGPKRALSDSSNDTSGTGGSGPKRKFITPAKIKVIKP